MRAPSVGQLRPPLRSLGRSLTGLSPLAPSIIRTPFCTPSPLVAARRLLLPSSAPPAGVREDAFSQFVGRTYAADESVLFPVSDSVLLDALGSAAGAPVCAVAAAVVLQAAPLAARPTAPLEVVQAATAPPRILRRGDGGPSLPWADRAAKLPEALFFHALFHDAPPTFIRALAAWVRIVERRAPLARCRWRGAELRQMLGSVKCLAASYVESVKCY